MKDKLIKAIELLESISLHTLGNIDANNLICAVRLLEDIYGENYIKVNVGVDKNINVADTESIV